MVTRKVFGFIPGNVVGHAILARVPDGYLVTFKYNSGYEHSHACGSFRCAAQTFRGSYQSRHGYPVESGQ
jgi:hypothetical protein